MVTAELVIGSEVCRTEVLSSVLVHFCVHFSVDQTN